MWLRKSSLEVVDWLSLSAVNCCGGFFRFSPVEERVAFSARPGLDLHDSRKLGLPFVAVFDQLLLVVQELLVQKCRVLVVRSLDDGINGACLLAEATEDALSHIDIVLSGTA